MVQSKLCDANYEETTEIDDHDDNIECNTYDVLFKNIDDKERTVVFGNKKHDFEHKNVIFFPVYIVIDDEVKDRIGVFETYLDKLPQIYDDDDEIDEQKINILLFDFVDKPFLSNYEKQMHETNDLLSDDNEDTDTQYNELITIGDEISENDLNIENLADDQDDDIFDVKVKKKCDTNNKDDKEELFEVDYNKSLPNMLNEETKTDAKENRKAYKESNTNNFIQKFMKNNNYIIHQNEGNGDCFFAIIRDAFKQIGKTTSIAKLRKVLSSKITKDMYEEYKQLYLDVENEINESKKQTNKHKTAIKDYKKRIKNIKTKQEHIEIVEKAKESSKLVKGLDNEIKENEKFIKQHVDFMKRVHSFEDFVEYIKTSDCYVDTTMISILEKELHIKFIILSETAFAHNDLDAVLYCGDSKGETNPTYYVIVSVSNKSYSLVSYKQKYMLTFREIPYDIKSLIMNKCLEKNSGSFFEIEDFKKIKEELHIDDYESDEEIDTSLFEDNIQFCFNDKSANAYPGLGNGEKIPKKLMPQFRPLSQISDWRRKLDHSYDKIPFTLDGYKWASVEHYYNASKFKKGFPDYYYSFSLDSNSNISKKASLAKEKGKKNDKYKIDPDFYSNRNIEEKKKAILCKFEQNEDLKNILLKTLNAKLCYYKRGSKPETDIELMQIRKQLNTCNL